MTSRGKIGTVGYKLYLSYGPYDRGHKLRHVEIFVGKLLKKAESNSIKFFSNKKIIRFLDRKMRKIHFWNPLPLSYTVVSVLLKNGVEGFVHCSVSYFSLYSSVPRNAIIIFDSLPKIYPSPPLQFASSFFIKCVGDGNIVLSDCVTRVCSSSCCMTCKTKLTVKMCTH